MKQNNSMKVQIKKDKRTVLLTGIALLLCLVIAGGFVVLVNSDERKLEHQLELGQKYLEEMDYERAITAYEAAIVIDPKCEEAYLELADIYTIQNEPVKAAEILEKGYIQTDSEIILAELEEIFAQFPEEDYGGITSEVVLAKLNEILAQNRELEKAEEVEKQVSGEEQTDGNKSESQDDIVLGDVFVQFVNAPFTDENRFGDDLISGDAAKAYAKSCGYVVGSDEDMSMGDLYLHYEDREVYFKDGEVDGQDSFLVIATKEDILAATGNPGDAGDASYTFYYYVEGKGEYLYTSLANPGWLTKENVPAIGGFSGFLAEYDCLTLESIIETIGLNDEKVLEAVHGNTLGCSTKVETPYGAVGVKIENYSDDWETSRCLQLTLLGTSDVPFTQINIEEGTYYSIFEDSTVHCLGIEAWFNTGMKKSMVK